MVRQPRWTGRWRGLPSANSVPIYRRSERDRLGLGDADQLGRHVRFCFRQHAVWFAIGLDLKSKKVQCMYGVINRVSSRFSFEAGRAKGVLAMLILAIL